MKNIKFIKLMSRFLIFALLSIITSPALAVYADELAKVTLESSSQNQLILEIDVPEFTTKDKEENGETYQLLTIKGTDTTENIGDPQLPYISRYIAVPNGASVNFELLSVERTVHENLYIFPAQPSGVEETIKSDVYSQDQLFPQQIASIEETITMRGQELVRINIYPIKFNPVTGELNRYTNLRIKITISGGTSYQDRKYASKPFNSILSKLAINYSEIEAAQSSYVAEDNLLIITPSKFKNEADRLAKWKKQKGINTIVKTTDGDMNVSGQDVDGNAAKIRNFIQTAYSTWEVPPTYILLIGDVRADNEDKTDDLMPTNYGLSAEGLTKNIGTDLYYTTMDGDGDTIADIIIGRLTNTKLRYVTKSIDAIIEYEKTPPTQENFYNNVALSGFFQDENGNGRTERRFVQTIEDIAIYLSDNDYLNQYSIDRLYDSNPDNGRSPSWWTDRSYYFFTEGYAANWCDDCGISDIPDYLLESNGFVWETVETKDEDGNITEYSPIFDSINDGRFLLVYSSHGTKTSWKNEGYGGHLMLSREAVMDLSNGSLRPVVWSMSCETGWFDGETDTDSGYKFSFAEVFGGQRDNNVTAIGVIAASRVSDGDMNARLLWGMTNAVWPGFLPNEPSDAVSDQPIYQIGAALNYGKMYMKSHYPSSNQTITQMFEMYHWFGDPTMEMWTDVPQSITADLIIDTIDPSQVTVNVDEADAVIAVSVDGELLGKAISNGSQTTIPLSPNLNIGDTIDIVITKHNFRPKIISYKWEDKAPVANLSDLSAYDDSVLATGTASDFNRDLISVWIEADGQSAQCLGTSNWTCSLSGLSAGVYSGNDAIVYAVDSQGNRSTNLQLEFEIIQEQVCEQYTETLNEHYADGRVWSKCTGTIYGSYCFFGEWEIYTTGTNQFISNNGNDSATLYEINGSGDWNIGSCPSDPEPPVIETVNTPIITVTGQSANTVTYTATVTGTASDINNDIDEIRIGVDTGYNACSGTTSFTCTIENIVMEKSDLPLVVKFSMYATDKAGNSSASGISPAVTLEVPPQCEEFTADLNEHYAEGRAWSECTGTIYGSYCFFGEWRVYAIGSNDFLSNNGNDIKTLYQENDSGIWHEGSCP